MIKGNCYKNEHVYDVYISIINRFKLISLLVMFLIFSQFVFAEENFSIEASDIDFIEGWQVDGAAANDGWLWENDFFFEARLNPSQTVDFECWDYDQDGSYDACYADGGSTLSTCLLIPEVASICSGTSCSGSGTNEYHSIDYVALGLDNTPLKREMQIDYVPDCNNFISLIHDDEDFFLIDRRRSVCDGDNWDVQGRWGTPDKYIKYVDKSCLASQTCDPALLDTRFVSSGDIDSPCRTKDGFSCSVDSDCLTGHFCCGGFCTSDQNDCFPDVNHTLNVDVDNILEGGPLRYAKVYVDSLLVGSTDVLGKKESPIAEGIREIEVLCPDDVTFCGGETRIVDGDEYVNYDCSCAVQKGDVQLNVDNVNGFPVVNVYAFLDGDESVEVGITNPFGMVLIEDVPYGSHDLDIYYRVTNPSFEGVYQTGASFVVDEPFETVNMVAALPGTNVPNQDEIQSVGFEGSLAITLTGVALTIVDVASVTFSTEELCRCILDVDDGAFASGFQNCINSIKGCVGDTRDCIGVIRAEAGSTVKECAVEEMFLVGDIASPFIPAGAIGHAAVWVGEATGAAVIIGPVTKNIKKVINDVIWFFKDKKILYKSKWRGFNLGFERVVDIGVDFSRFSSEAWGGVEILAKEVDKIAPDRSNAIIKTMVEKLDSEIDLEQVFSGISKLKERNVPGTDSLIIKLSMEADNLARNPDNVGIFGNAIGTSFEFLAASRPQFVDNLAKINTNEIIVDGTTQIDAQLLDGTILEFKRGPSVNIKSLNGQINRQKDYQARNNLGDIKYYFQNEPNNVVKDVLMKENIQWFII